VERGRRRRMEKMELGQTVLSPPVIREESTSPEETIIGWMFIASQTRL